MDFDKMLHGMHMSVIIVPAGQAFGPNPPLSAVCWPHIPWAPIPSFSNTFWANLAITPLAKEGEAERLRWALRNSEGQQSRGGGNYYLDPERVPHGRRGKAPLPTEEAPDRVLPFDGI